jgi:hypothetical protein
LAPTDPDRGAARAGLKLTSGKGYLRQKYLTETIGFDEPETRCRMGSNDNK